MADDLNSPAAQQKMMRRVYHRDVAEGQPGYTDMYAVDAAAAVRDWPDDHSLEPFHDDQPPPTAGVAIPSEWRDMSNAQLRALAMRLGAPSDVRASEAEELIATEEKRRADVHSAHAEILADREARAAKAPSGPVEIPAGWQDQSAAQRRALARKLGAPNTVTAEQADDIISAEVARRGGPKE